MNIITALPRYSNGEVNAADVRVAGSAAPQRLKWGDVRDDGMVFWSYHKDCMNGQVWLTRERFESRRLAAMQAKKKNRRENPEHFRKKERQYRIQKREEIAARNRRAYYNNRDPIIRTVKGYDPVIARNKILKKVYGINLETYNSMLDSQGGRCAICGTDHTTEKKLHVDHCHETGKIRGLLCSNCNTAIGLLKDDSSLMIKASNYCVKNEHSNIVS